MSAAPTTLRALADRVCAEEPSDELSTALMRAMPDDVWSKVNNPLHNLSDAAAMMPAGWRVIIHQNEDNFRCTVWQLLFDVLAPTEPRARTAAALRVRAAMMEDGE